MASNRPKGFVKTSEKAYLAWVTLPGAGIKVPGTSFCTEKGAPYVLYTFGNTYRIMSGSELAAKFTFDNGDPINPDTVRSRIVTGVMKWTAVRRKADTPVVWARHEPSRGNLGFFHVCPNAGGEPELSNARKIRGETFAALYNMSRFPNIATHEQLNASPEKPAVELAAPKKVSESAAKTLAAANVDATRFTAKFAEGLSATKLGIESRQGYTAEGTGVTKTDKGLLGGLTVKAESAGEFTVQFALKDDKTDKVAFEIKAPGMKNSNVIPLDLFAKGGAIPAITMFKTALVKSLAEKAAAEKNDVFMKMKTEIETKVLPQLEGKFPQMTAVQAPGQELKRLIIKPKNISKTLGAAVCVVFPAENGYGYKFAASRQNTLAERIIAGLLEIKPSFESSCLYGDLSHLTGGILKCYNAVATYERREKERTEREKRYDFDLVGLMKNREGKEMYILLRRGTDKKTAATREQLIAVAEAGRVSNVYVQTYNDKKKIRVLGGTLAGMRTEDTTDIARSRISVASAEVERAELFAEGVLAKLAKHDVTMPEFTPPAPDGNGVSSAAFACDKFEPNTVKFVFNLKAHTYFIAGQIQTQCRTAAEMAKGITAWFRDLLGIKVTPRKKKIVPENSALSGIEDDFADESLSVQDDSASEGSLIQDDSADESLSAQNDSSNNENGDVPPQDELGLMEALVKSHADAGIEMSYKYSADDGGYHVTASKNGQSQEAVLSIRTKFYLMDSNRKDFSKRSELAGAFKAAVIEALDRKEKGYVTTKNDEFIRDAKRRADIFKEALKPVNDAMEITAARFDEAYAAAEQDEWDTVNSLFAELKATLQPAKDSVMSVQTHADNEIAAIQAEGLPDAQTEALSAVYSLNRDDLQRRLDSYSDKLEALDSLITENSKPEHTQAEIEMVNPSGKVHSFVPDEASRQFMNLDGDIKNRAEISPELLELLGERAS